MQASVWTCLTVYLDSFRLETYGFFEQLDDRGIIAIDVPVASGHHLKNKQTKTLQIPVKLVVTRQAVIRLFHNAPLSEKQHRLFLTHKFSTTLQNSTII